MKDKDPFVDQLLDSALAHHRAAEPRHGLEGRVLERVHATAGEEIRKAWKLWVAAAASAAVLVMFVAIRVANRSHSPAVETSEAVNTVPSTSSRQILTANSGATRKAGTASAAVELKQIEHRMRMSPRHVEAHHWPSQFPTPAPLTAEQKALVQYVRETPPQVLAEPILKAELTVQPVEIKPLETPPLEMKPLALGPVGKELQ